MRPCRGRYRPRLAESGPALSRHDTTKRTPVAMCFRELSTHRGHKARGRASQRSFGASGCRSARVPDLRHRGALLLSAYVKRYLIRGKTRPQRRGGDLRYSCSSCASVSKKRKKRRGCQSEEGHATGTSKFPSCCRRRCVTGAPSFFSAPEPQRNAGTRRGRVLLTAISCGIILAQKFFGKPMGNRPLMTVAEMAIETGAGKNLVFEAVAQRIRRVRAVSGAPACVRIQLACNRHHQLRPLSGDGLQRIEEAPAVAAAVRQG